MENYFIQGGVIAAIFAIFKFFEARVSKIEMQPKTMIRDTVIVYISAVVGAYIILQTGSKLNPKATNAFIGNPEF